MVSCPDILGAKTDTYLSLITLRVGTLSSNCRKSELQQKSGIVSQPIVKEDEDEKTTIVQDVRRCTHDGGDGRGRLRW